MLKIATCSIASVILILQSLVAAVINDAGSLRDYGVQLRDESLDDVDTSIAPEDLDNREFAGLAIANAIQAIPEPASTSLIITFFLGSSLFKRRRVRMAEFVMS